MKLINRLTLLIVVGVCITTALPVLAAIVLSRQQAMDREQAYVTGLAQNALARSEQTAAQLQAGSRLVSKLTPQQACSDQGLDLMRRIDLGSTLLQAVGYIEGNVMRCSSFGGRRAFVLGAADFRSRIGADIRTDVRLIDPKLSYLAVASGPFVGIVHKELVLSFVDDVPGLTISVFSWSHRKPLLVRGGLQSDWITGAGANPPVYRTDDHIIAVVRSRHNDLGAVAALPISQAQGFVREAIVLIPIGLVAGLLLSGVLVYVIRSRVSMPAVIRAALKADEFYLDYQPVIDLSTGKIVGAEALARWRRSRGNLIPPDIFIAAAEQSGIVSLITERVLELLSRDTRHVVGILPCFHFAVNFSAADMHKPTIAQDVEAFLARAGIGPGNLVIEATERCFVNVELARETMRNLRSAGIKVAIDDFGTGYSSLGYLAQLEIDYLKIDKLFVHALGTDSATSQVAGRIIQMAKDLKLQIVAEGIETVQQEHILKGLKVEFAQGFRYGAPMSMDDLLQHLRADRARPVVQARKKAA